MESFKLSLSNDAIVTGLVSLPDRDQVSGPSTLPLIVAVHGGTYSASYFFADDQHSALPVSSALGVPFLAINRPGYKDSTAILPFREDSTYFQEEGRHLHEEILPAIWKEYASRLGISSIILMTHSMGAFSAIVAAALNCDSNLYPLAGLIISGIGTELRKGKGLEAQLEMLKAKPASLVVDFGKPCGGLGSTNIIDTNSKFPTEFKDLVMLGKPDQKMADPSIYKQTEPLQSEIGYYEIFDGLTQWLSYWTRYASRVAVPVMYGLAEADGLWDVSEQFVRDFAAAFEKSPRVESGIVLGSAHCSELCRVGRGWYSRGFGFAMECAVAKDLGRF